MLHWCIDSALLHSFSPFTRLQEKTGIVCYQCASSDADGPAGAITPARAQSHCHESVREYVCGSLDRSQQHCASGIASTSYFLHILATAAPRDGHRCHWCLPVCYVHEHDGMRATKHGVPRQMIFGTVTCTPGHILFQATGNASSAET